MAREVAARRHAIDQWYMVLLTAGGRPVQTIERWKSGLWRVYLFDDSGRRDHCIDLRPRPDGTLLVTRRHRFWYTAEHREFDDSAAQEMTTVSAEGEVTVKSRPAGSRGWSSIRRDNVLVEDSPIPAPDFGDWLPFTRLLTEQGHECAATLTLHDAPAPPPRPSHPNGVQTLFTPGAQVAAEGVGASVIDVRPAGTLYMPSGRLIVADPTSASTTEPLVAAVPPGDYPVSVSILRSLRYPEMGYVAAARLTITDEPVKAWEPALCPDDDPTLLASDESIGFGVDAGMGCFVDAVAQLDEMDEDRYLDALGSDFAAEVTVAATGANMVVFRTGLGDGGYPKWLGRTEDGRIACFVADMQLIPADA
ncbi:Protein of unknown function [Micromonospora citrea]|uniref:DUF4241 domain-containing protein n=2 Tax=Micromonospora citrea TaxID=47855 RepID=A0A1C6TTJ0_9ACTN|nr:Protein of unknown function [Micromonospora citrea]